MLEYGFMLEQVWRWLSTDSQLFLRLIYLYERKYLHPSRSAIQQMFSTSMMYLYPIIFSTSILLLYSSTAADENLCPCKFDGNDNENCRVYGQLGDDKLIPWYVASQDCLDAHNIKISAIPSYTLESMCNPPNANGFVNYLKFEVREYEYLYE